MPPLIFPLYDPDNLSLALETGLSTDRIAYQLRKFPDDETYLKIDTDVKGREVIIFAALDRPDTKIMPLLIAAGALRSQGANKLILIAPYLPYMRQDKQFQPGEAITSRTFASTISRHFDRLITLDPHLHRYKTLAEIYTCETERLTATPLLASWIEEHVSAPFLIGPDSESRQWVSDLSKNLNAPFDVLSKARHGDHNVTISAVDTSIERGMQIILVDDTISTATTMCESVRKIFAAGYEAPVCCAVHGIFAETAYSDLLAAGAKQIVTTNTIKHRSNQIDIAHLLVDALS